MLSEQISFDVAKVKDHKLYGLLPDLPGGFSITDQEEEYSESLYQFLDALPQMAWIADTEGSIDFMNKRWAEYTGIENADLLRGPALLQFLHPEDSGNMSKLWNEAFLNGTAFELEYRWLRGSDKTYRWHLGRIAPVKNAEGKIIKWVGTCTDIDDQKKQELYLQKKNSELKQINDDLDSFVYMASHDLKLPVVNTVGLFDELLATVQFKENEGPRMAEMIKQSLAQIQGIIQDLGDIVKVQREINATVDDIDLASLLTEIEADIAGQIASSNTRIMADFSHVPVIRFCRGNLKSVLYNLLSNAIKFRAGERSPEIKIRSWRRGSAYCLEVSDNGIGLDMDRYGDKMFQMFRRFHGHVPGSGLGLYLVNRIMQNSGGKVEVKSIPGQGATFTLCFTDITSLPDGSR